MMPPVPNSGGSFLSAAPKNRPFGLVFIVFYWVVNGLAALAVGMFLTFASGIGQQVLGQARGRMGSPAFPSEAEMTIYLIAYEFAAVALYLYGLLLLVASYGLWTFRKWGLAWAKGLAVVSVVLNLLAAVAAIASRAGVVNGLIGTALSTVILIYLFGRLELSNHLQVLASRTHAFEKRDWSEFS